MLLLVPVFVELTVGNIHLLLAAAIVAGFRWPWLWALPLLTKVTPGMGLLWFAVRREWRNLAIAARGDRGHLALVSFVLAPEPVVPLARGPRRGREGARRGCSPSRSPLWVRALAVAVPLVGWGARTDRRWTVPVAAMLGLPILRVNGLAMLVAVIPFVPRLVGESPASRWLAARGVTAIPPAVASAPAASASLRDRLLRPTFPELWTFIAIALPALAALVATLPTVDLAYQLRAGAEILDGRGIPSADTWTFTAAGRPWLDQGWGAQAILAAIYEAGGWTGLAVFRAALVAVIFGLVLLAVRRRAPGIGGRTAAWLTLAAFVVAAPALALRPQLLGMVCFAGALVLLAGRRERPGLALAAAAGRGRVGEPPRQLHPRPRRSSGSPGWRTSTSDRPEPDGRCSWPSSRRPRPSSPRSGWTRGATRPGSRRTVR